MNHRVRRWQEYGCLLIVARVGMRWLATTCWISWKLWISECKSGAIARRNRHTQDKGEAIARLTSNYSYFAVTTELKRKCFHVWLKALMELRYTLLSELRDAEKRRVHENMSRARFQQMRAEIISMEREAVADMVARRWNQRAIKRNVVNHWVLVLGGALMGDKRAVFG